MRKIMTPDALPHRGTAALSRVAIGLALAACAGMTLWGVGIRSVSIASEFGRNAAPETPMTLEDRVAALTAELAQVKAETAKLREGQSDSFVEFSQIRASLANAEIGLAALRTTSDENEARRRDTAAQIEQNLAHLKHETHRLRMTQDDTTTELGSLRAGVANSEIAVDSLRGAMGGIRQKIDRIEAVRDATGSIAGSHRHHGHRRWVAQR
jgi:hypothetical protein